MAARDVRFLGDGLEACAMVYAAQGQAERAAHWLGAAAFREAIGMLRRMDVPTTDDIEAAVVPARAALGEAAWAAAFAAVQALSLEKASAEALGEDERAPGVVVKHRERS